MESEIIRLIRGELSERRVVHIVNVCGVTFPLDTETDARLRAAGATSELLSTIRANVRKPQCAGPVTLEKTESLIVGNILPERIEAIVGRCGIDYVLTTVTERRLSAAGAAPTTLALLRVESQKHDDAARAELDKLIEARARQSLADEMARQASTRLQYRAHHQHAWIQNCEGNLTITAEGLSYVGSKHQFSFRSTAVTLSDCSDDFQTVCVKTGDQREKFVLETAFAADLVKVAKGLWRQQ